MNIKKIIKEEMGDIEWIENVEAKWDIHNIHLVAGKKFHLTRARFTASTANKVYWFSDETKPNKRSIKICWEDTNFSVECGKISRLRVIDLLNNNDWILLDDVIIESTEEISTPHLSESDKIKNMIKEEIDGMEWIKDVKSNQDIAQEIADKSEIKNDLLYTPFPPFPFSTFPLSIPHPSLPFSTRLLSSFTKYCEEQYGLSKDDVNDIWKRYKEIVKDKINNHNINENDDMDWIRDVEPISYDFLVGKALYFDPSINDYEHLLPIVETLESMGFTTHWVDDFYEAYSDQIIGMYLREHDDQIIFTTDLNDFEEEYQEHIDEYAYRPVEVLDGWRILGPHLGTV